MRLVQFEEGGHTHVGIETDQNSDIVDFTRANPDVLTMIQFLKDCEKNMEDAKRILNDAKYVVKRENVRILSPITNPEKIICIGMNYTDHCEELGKPIPTNPVVFSKFSNCITHPGAGIIYPKLTEQLDWEVELAVIIGKSGKNIEEKNAMEHVFGYTVAHDVTARDWVSKNGGPWLLAKTFDTFLPLGPAIVTRDSISAPHNLGIRCKVNGELMQNSNTKNQVFKIERLISYVSQFTTLTAGDVISTGTPPGVGCFKKPPVFLKVGDVVECEIDEIGRLQNTIVAE